MPPITPISLPKSSFTSSESATFENRSCCGTVQLTVLFNEQREPVQVLFQGGKNGSCIMTQLRVLQQMVNLNLKNGAIFEEIALLLKGHSCFRSTGTGNFRQLSCIDAIGKLFSEAVVDSRSSVEESYQSQA